MRLLANRLRLFVQIGKSTVIDAAGKSHISSGAPAARLYDERLCRMMEFYLAAVEMTFRHGSAMVFQMQLAHVRDATPITRDYITDADRAARSEGET